MKVSTLFHSSPVTASSAGGGCVGRGLSVMVGGCAGGGTDDGKPYVDCTQATIEPDSMRNNPIKGIEYPLALFFMLTTRLDEATFLRPLAIVVYARARLSKSPIGNYVPMTLVLGIAFCQYNRCSKSQVVLHFRNGNESNGCGSLIKRGSNGKDFV